MYSLCSGLYTSLFARPQYQIVVLGLDEAGKSTLLESAKASAAGRAMKARLPPTVGLNVGRAEVGGARLVLWDLGGQLGLRIIWEKYYADAHAVMYVVDAANEQRMAEAALELGGALEHEELRGAPVLVVANKQDADGALPAEEVRRRIPVNRQGRRVAFLGASALHGEGVAEALEWLADTVRACPRTSRLALGATY